MALPVRDILLNANGDRVLVGNDYGRASGLQAVSQGIRNRVGLILKEYWLNTALGVDWTGVILVKNPNALLIKSQIAPAIADTPNVTRVANIDLIGPDANRHAEISYSAVTDFGLVTGTVADPNG